MTNLERAILKALLAKGYTLNPMSYVQDGQYTNYNEWDSVDLGHEFLFYINFYSDGEKFYISAYPLFMTDSGIYDIDNQNFFHVKVYQLQGVVA